MTTDRRIVLHHAPNTRSTGTLILVEELAADYEMKVLDFKFGERYTAADVLWGTALGWTTQWGLVSKTPVIERYVQAFDARPAAIRVRAADAELAARMA